MKSNLENCVETEKIRKDVKKSDYSSQYSELEFDDSEQKQNK